MTTINNDNRQYGQQNDDDNVNDVELETTYKLFCNLEEKLTKRWFFLLILFLHQESYVCLCVCLSVYDTYE